MNWFRLHDSQSGSGMLECPPSEAKRWNDRGWGIFWTVNTFNGPRQISHLARIEFWAIDIDEGSKEEQQERIEKGLPPSRIVETKRGYQVYWRACDAKPENWDAILVERLVPYYGADTKARDIARVLRVPGYLHLKDPANPFLVAEVHRSKVAYTEAQMLTFYRPHKKPDPKYPPLPTFPVGEDESKRAERATKYLARIPGAISGQGGHDQTFYAALVLVRGFALSEGIALSLLASDYNPRCQPEWSRRELEHKVKSAASGRVPYGFKLGSAA